MFQKPLSDFLIHWHINVMILGLVTRIVGNVEINGVVSRFWYAVSIFFKWLKREIRIVRKLPDLRGEWTHLETPLFLSSVIHTRCNNVPSRIYIRQLSPECWACSCHSKL